MGNQSRVRVKILVRTISCGASDAVIRNSFEEKKNTSNCPIFQFAYRICGQGRISSAEEIFSGLRDPGLIPDVVTYIILKSQDVAAIPLELLSCMKKCQGARIKPTLRTYYALAIALINAGRI